jgi:hypothetical protein
LYVYEVKATDPNGDRLNYSLLIWPGSMTIDSNSGKIIWYLGDSDLGNYSVVVQVRDGRGGEARQEFVIWVHPIMKPRVTIIYPHSGISMSGICTFTGNVDPGSYSILCVQLRIDSGEWINATGNLNWLSKVDTTRLKDGSHMLYVRAPYANGSSDIISIPFLTKNVKTINVNDILLPSILIIGIIIGVLIIVVRRRKGR